MPFWESFQSTLRSNKSIMVDKSKRFVKTLGGFDSTRKNQFDFQKATPEQLKEIRERILKENRKNLTRLIVSFIILSILVFYILDFLVN